MGKVWGRGGEGIGEGVVEGMYEEMGEGACC